jgi:hypothetical protein
MTKVTKILVTALCFSGLATAQQGPAAAPVNLAAVSVLSVPVAVAASGPLTNVGRLASQQVVLSNLGPACGGLFARVKPDGSNTCPYAISPGHLLVITDMEWSLPGPQFGGTPGTYATLNLEDSAGNVVAFSAALADINGTASKSEHFTAGVVLGAVPGVITGGSPFPVVPGVVLRGYEVPNQ